MIWSRKPMSAVSPHPPEPRGLLAERTVVVTAAAGTGIGFATARRCALEGATVLLSDRHEGRLAQYAERLAEEIGEPVGYCACDVTDDAAVARLVAHAVDSLGRIDVWINNAGVGFTRPVVDTSEADWQRVIDTSLSGTFRCLRAVLPHMIEREAGVVINVGSVVGWRAEAGQAAYAAAKAGVAALTRCAALEAAPHGVRVNTVVPSLALHENVVKVSDPEFLAELVSREPLRRAAEPWEIASTIIFLASDLASYLTGESLAVSSRHP